MQVVHSIYSDEGFRLDSQDEASLILKTLRSGTDEGGTWAVATLTGAWSGGSTFTVSETEPGTYTATYTVETPAIGACGEVQTSSVCIKLTVFDSALPVILESFTAKALTESGTRAVLVQWKTTEESNTDKFEIERIVLMRKTGSWQAVSKPLVKVQKY
jgi:hypothetical protein